MEVNTEEEKGDSKDILPIFWDLASLDEEKRIERVVDLIAILKERVEKFASKEHVNEEVDIKL